MSAAACLQVVVSARKGVAYNFDVMATVAKVTNAFLESRWAWPRKFSALSRTSYLLSDPRAARLDTAEIQSLSNELQVRLFGAGDAGEVALALFEGTLANCQRFAHLRSDELKALLDGRPAKEMGLQGRLVKLTVQGASVLEDTSSQTTQAAAVLEDQPAIETKLIYRGIYLAPKQQFIGSLVSRWRRDDQRTQSVLDSSAHFPLSDPEAFDLQTIEAIAEAFSGEARLQSVLFVPLSYSALARRSARERYAVYLKKLSPLPKDLLTARIYDVPRMPQMSLLVELGVLLHEYCSMIDLSVADPCIELDLIPAGAVRGVTLVLPDADEMLRCAALRRFMEKRERLREKHLWPTIANVRTHHEMQICAAAKAPFLSGPAISGILEAPIGMTPFLPEGLPLRAEAA